MVLELPIIVQSMLSILGVLMVRMRILWNIAVVLATIMIVCSRSVASEVTMTNTTSSTHQVHHHVL